MKDTIIQEIMNQWEREPKTCFSNFQIGFLVQWNHSDDFEITEVILFCEECSEASHGPEFVEFIDHYLVPAKYFSNN